MGKRRGPGDDLTDDVKVFLGLPPYDGGSNYCKSDGYYYQRLKELWGEEKLKAEVKRLSDRKEKWRRMWSDW